MKKISLIIPCYNEEGNIKYLFKNFKKLKVFKNLEIVLVDNGSKDLTYNTILSHKKKNKNLNIKIMRVKRNIGFGNGVFQGLKKSKGDYLCYTHADREAKISEIIKVIKIISKNLNTNFLIKGKRVNRIKNNWKLIHEFFSRSCDLTLSIILFSILPDIHAQPNAFPRKLLKKFPIILMIF